jgi:predicted ribosome quality control (RQC) complex YloA/Tae2 family protein
MAVPAGSVPKDRFSSIDTLALVRELRSVGPARIDKVFDTGSGAVSLTLRRGGQEKRELLIVPGRYAAVLPSGVPHTEELGHLVRELRRWLSGSVIQEVTQSAGERYFEITLSRGDLPDALLLSAELFGTGNLLLARGGKLVVVAQPRTWAHRTIRVGSEYVRPPSRKDPWTSTPGDLESVLTLSRTDRASTLAARLALGGPVAEELLARAQLSGQAPAPTDAPEVAERLHRAISALLGEIGDRPKGYLYYRGETPLDVEPFRSRRWEDDAAISKVELPSFSEAAHRYFGSEMVLPERARPAPVDPMAEVRRQRAQQAAAITGLAEEAQLLMAEAQRIFTNYAEAEAGLARMAHEEGPPRFEVPLEGLPTRLFRDRSPRESAQAIYEEAKRVQAKLSGAQSALEGTDHRLVDWEARKAPPRPALSGGGADRPRKHHWFEKYRWFISSEGAIVIGGRDAATNDLVVRRYLNPDDTYVHADIHGAPSVIVKHPAPGEPALTDASMVEAAQWGVSFSKAWRVGLASADAFWVAADQVSKAAASGEFVARGAWVIHGTKHVVRDVPTELAIGPISYQNGSLWSVAPPAALRARGEVRFLLTPGDERERLSREKELAGDLGVSRDLIQGLLPSGGITVRRA